MVALVNAPTKTGNTKTFLTDCFLQKKPKLSHFFIYIVIYFLPVSEYFKIFFGKYAIIK